MKNEEAIGKLYLFILRDDCTIEKRELKLIRKNPLYYVTRDPVTCKRNSYPLGDLNVYKFNRVLLDTDDIALAKDIMVKALFKKMVETQTKATIAMGTYTRFREVNR